jgi:RNA polymerase sigma-70 factor (ECF subfamily)
VKEQGAEQEGRWTQENDVIARYGAMVYRLAYARLQNRHDADDIFQEVFLRYVRRAPIFENVEHGKAWFLRTTLNCCKNFWMSAWHRRTEPLTEIPEQPFEYEWEETQALAQGLAELPMKYRTVLHLYYYEDLTAEEIGRLLHSPAGTVRMQLSRGRVLLKEKLEGGMEDAGTMETAISKSE